MKEAAGEANMTVVTIILIGIVLAVATPLITNFMKSTQSRTECTSKGMCYDGVECVKCKA